MPSTDQTRKWSRQSWSPTRTRRKRWGLLGCVYGKKHVKFVSYCIKFSQTLIYSVLVIPLNLVSRIIVVPFLVVRRMSLKEDRMWRGHLHSNYSRYPLNESRTLNLCSILTISVFCISRLLGCPKRLPGQSPSLYLQRSVFKPCPQSSGRQSFPSTSRPLKWQSRYGCGK